MTPAVFLDRDGVIIEDVHHLSEISQVKLYPGISQSITLLNEQKIPVIVITNQSGCARGYFPESRIHEVHEHIQSELNKAGAHVDDWYYCPHHPEITGPCECRKPGIGMIQQACAKHPIDLARSWLVGDKTSDIQCAINAGISSILVETGYSGTDAKYQVQASQQCPSLIEAVDFILSQSETA